MPGMTLLSSRTEPSSAVIAWLRVCMKPAVAGPKPTQAISTSIVWRSIFMSSSTLARIVKGFGDHHLGKCCRRPAFRQSRAGHADVEPGAQFDETGSTAFGTGAGFIEMCTIFLDGVAKATTITGDTRHDRIEGI